MASTTGLFYLRPRFSAFTAGPKQTTGTFFLPIRFVSGIYSAGGGISSGGKKTIRPRRDDVWVNIKDGTLTEKAYRFIEDLWERKIGGDLAPTLPQVTTSVVATQVATAAITGTQANIIQAVQQNAASTAATIEVQVAAGTPGATQVPPPVLTVPVYTPRTNQAVE